MYISQDPIRLSGGLTLYSYVGDPNGWVDVLGLKPVNAGDNLTEHNMSQDVLGYLPRIEGGAIVITQEKHEQTRTYGGKGTKRDDAGKSFRYVLIADIEDLKSITGDKYNESITDLIAYYEDKGMLEERDLTLKNIEDGTCHK